MIFCANAASLSLWFHFFSVFFIPEKPQVTSRIQPIHSFLSALGNMLITEIGSTKLKLDLIWNYWLMAKTCRQRYHCWQGMNYLMLTSLAISWKFGGTKPDPSNFTMSRKTIRTILNQLTQPKNLNDGSPIWWVFLFGLMLTIDQAVKEMPDPLVDIAMPLAPIAIENWHWQKNQLPIQFKARLGICLNEGGIRVWLS